MKDFVLGPVFRYPDLQRIDDAADRIQQTSGKKPEESRTGQHRTDVSDLQNRQPAHGDVDDRGNISGTVDPEEFHDDPGKCQGPDPDQQGQSLLFQQTETDRCVGSGDQKEDGDVIDLLQDPGLFFRKKECMVGAAGTVEDDQAQTVDAGTGHGHQIIMEDTGFRQKDRCQKDEEKKTDKMAQSTHRILDMGIRHDLPRLRDLHFTHVLPPYSFCERV